MDDWPEELPQQTDGSSCGVFVAAYAEALARGVNPLHITPDKFDCGNGHQVMARSLVLHLPSRDTEPADNWLTCRGLTAFANAWWSTCFRSTCFPNE